jgi:hypothetical protein
MDAIQKFKDLKEKIDVLSNEKIRIDERYKSERGKLEKLLKEITAKGYDPTKLSETRALKEKELEKALADIEIKVNEVSSKLNLIEVN